MPRYDDYSREELLRLLEARNRRNATWFGLELSIFLVSLRDSLGQMNMKH